MAVAGPIAAILAPAKARPSSPSDSSLAATTGTAFALVKTIQSYCPRLARAASSSDVSAIGAIRITGNSTGSAPRAISRSESALACSRARVTSTRFPKSGRDRTSSNQRSVSRSRTTSPTMQTAGGVSFARFTSSTIVLSVPVTTRCFVQVPHCTSATGVSAARPCS